jgi:hypothetical protein
MWFSMPEGCQCRRGQFTLSIQSANHLNEDDTRWILKRHHRKIPRTSAFVAHEPVPNIVGAMPVQLGKVT